jgi:hypothetical protein
METLQRTANRGSISTGYDIDNSVKLEADDSQYIDDRHYTAGNRQKLTISFWFKRTELGQAQMPFEQSALQARIYLRSTDDLYITAYDSSGWTIITNRLFRDPSAWYHCVFQLDTTQSTAADRMKLWINGEQETSFSSASYPTQNADTFFNTNQSAKVGGGGAGLYFSGYMSEFFFIDDQALQASDFGEYDSDSGIWIPKEYDGTFGGQSYYLEFKNASNLADRSDGLSNGVSLSVQNITSADQATDTPTNNGCTLNVLASLEGSNDITEGALVSTGKAGGGGNFNGTYGTIGIDPFNSSVDWYWEIETSIGTSGSDTDIGIGWIKESRITSGSTAYNNVYADGISRYSSQTANAAGDIWGVLLETGATPVMKLYRNDGLIYTATHGSGGVSFDTLMFPYITVKGTSVDARLNFLNPASSFSIASGNTDPNGYGNFEFDPKGGYALCTKNLAEYG